MRNIMCSTFEQGGTPITQAGVYHNPSLGLISLSDDGTNWITIADKNLGATTVYNDGDNLSESNCGGYFQWGNNYMFSFTGNVTASRNQVDASGYGPGNYYNDSTFIYLQNDRSSVQNDNLWGDTTDTLVARQGPNLNGFHVPSIIDFSVLESVLNSLGIDTSNGNCMKTYLKMPYAGHRSVMSSNVENQNTQGIYRTSSPQGTDSAYYVIFKSNNLNFSAGTDRTDGQSIRPFKNESVQPDSRWTILYQPVLP